MRIYAVRSRELVDRKEMNRTWCKEEVMTAGRKLIIEISGTARKSFYVIVRSVLLGTEIQQYRMFTKYSWFRASLSWRML